MENTKSTGWLLALLGFLPFLAGTIIEFLPASSDYALIKAYGLQLLPLYGAVILSFMGGIRWGIAMTDQTTESQNGAMVASVVPALWAWGAVFFAAPINYVLLAVGFAAAGIWDRRLSANPRVPVWYVTMRTVLTWLVTLSLLAASVGTNMTLIGLAFL